MIASYTSVSLIIQSCAIHQWCYCKYHSSCQLYYSHPNCQNFWTAVFSYTLFCLRYNQLCFPPLFLVWLPTMLMQEAIMTSLSSFLYIWLGINRWPKWITWRTSLQSIPIPNATVAIKTFGGCFLENCCIANDFFNLWICRISIHINHSIIW